MDIHELPENSKVILKKLGELQENTVGKLDKMKKMIRGQNKTMNKDTKPRNKTKQILEPKDHNK